MRATRTRPPFVRLAAAVVAAALLAAGCTVSDEGGASSTTEAADIPTQQIHYTYLPGTDSLAWIRDNSELIMTARLVEIRPGYFSRYDPEEMDDIERVYKGIVFEPADVYVGEVPPGEVVVLDPASDRDRFSKKTAWYLVSDAYPVSDRDVGTTFLLFLVQSYMDPGSFAFTSGRHGIVLVRDNGRIETHRPGETTNPWLAYKNAGLDAILADLGLSGS